jgi:hypothetical protein
MHGGCLAQSRERPPEREFHVIANSHDRLLNLLDWLISPELDRVAVAIPTPAWSCPAFDQDDVRRVRPWLVLSLRHDKVRSLGAENVPRRLTRLIDGARDDGYTGLAQRGVLQVIKRHLADNRKDLTGS